MPLLTLPILVLIAITGSPSRQSHDTTAAHRVFTRATQSHLTTEPIGGIVCAIGKSFIGSPYEAGTLDAGDSEVCVANLKTFDCVTFVENVLALSSCIKSGHTSYNDYLSELTRIRYRGGICAGYTSRLHYFSSWIEDNAARGNITDVTSRLGGSAVVKPVRFMTAHRNKYPRLADENNFREIKKVEDSLSAHPRWIIPSGQVREMEPGIRDGDIIAVATSVEGLDVSHTGIAVRGKDGSVHLLHAPDIGETVTIMQENLAAYLLKNPSRSGIIVLRPLEP
jgi:hypothetical protein